MLADVFMPVRNGYEVCQYVKSDESLAHIPVILLVGAFDPLDEQEAQRVGADGVLKKPFVPPDPLISMVKSALARAGVPIGGAAPPPPKQEEPLRVAEMLAPRTAPPVQNVPAMGAFGSVPEIPAVDNEPMHEAMPGMPEPVKIAAGSGPLAFGNLLETSETEAEEDLGYATTARPELERDWKSGDEEEGDEVVEEEEEKQSASWRLDGGDEAMENEEAGSGATKDWRETAFAEAPARRMKHESWSPQKEISRFEEAAETEQSVGAMVKESPVTEKRMAPAAAAPFAEDAWAAALKPKAGVETATAEKPAVAETAQIEQAAALVEAGPSAYSAEPVEEVHEAKKPAAENSWFSAVSSPWDEEVQKA
ncbi:MAG: response regulator, partial [Candidatus Binataceae bacterium]